ncbi:MAG: hypothetical protein U1E59_15170 [Amaricoccus sp.]
MRQTDLAAPAALAVAVGPALAQAPASAPFRDETIALAQAAALERVDATARALGVVKPSAVDQDDNAAAAPAAADDEDDDAAGSMTADVSDDDGASGSAAAADDEASGGMDADDDDEGLLRVDLSLLRASLAAASPKLANAFAGAVGEMAEAVDAGEDPVGPAKEVVGLTEEVRTALLTSDAAATPAFRGALIAALLVDEGGVSETNEAATEHNATAYATGYFVLQRVKALWEGLASQAAPEQAADIGQMLGILERLFPGAEVPSTLSADPEEAEAPSHQLVTLLETVTQADLYPGRDLPGAAALVHDLAQKGCEALKSDDKRDLGIEELAIARGYYGQTIGDTLSMMAPDASQAIAHGFIAMTQEADEIDPDDCGPLLEALAQGKQALAP